MQTVAPPSTAGQDLKMLGSPGNSQRVTIEGTGAWIWGASVEPGLGPTVHCSLSKHQPKTSLGMHKKENRYIMQLKATVGKVPTPPLPWDSIQDPLGGREC